MKQINTDSFRVTRLWDVFADHKFAIPEIQREFVWDAKKACALLDSIYKKLPIGSVLVWETDGHNRTLLRHSLHILPTYNDRNRHIWFLIDGQQRLSVLYQVREGQKVENSNGKVVDFGKIHFLFDHHDAPFKFVSVRRPDPSQHYPVKDILADDWQRRMRLLPKYKKREIRECRRHLTNYVVPFIFVKTNRLEEVRESFIRINSKGTPISAADRAFTRASRFDLRHLANQTRSGLAHGFNEIARETLLQAFAFARGEKDLGERAVLASIDKLEKRLKTDKTVLKQFARDWKRVSHAIGRAVDYLVTTLGVPSFSYLPSANMVATLTLFFYHNGLSQPTPRQMREIRKWFWATGVGQRYTGRGYNQNIQRDVKFFRCLASRGRERFVFRDLVPKSDLKHSDYSRRSGLTDAFFCLLYSKEPRYLENGAKLPFAHSTRSNRKDKHHIFPRELLKRNGFSDKMYNSLCNVCFIVARENQSIGSKKPIVYLDEFRRRRHFGRVMSSHLIPHTNGCGLWESQVRRGYKKFQSERLELICRMFKREAGISLFRKD